MSRILAKFLTPKVEPLDNADVIASLAYLARMARGDDQSGAKLFPIPPKPLVTSIGRTL